ncbi:hypothetical protein TNIN_42631 [Trichonephila inaurata madagascariensis]|uniref:Uncharacterized protein n=1 Tax=Trichonephila inaurata madagascariensis TaxID=2747483 RepID=A0A8X6MH48_9ARAC|nr:hypothetical protein TNIN_42631 [Trichonephila inaurata madagascariensis]
MFLRCTNREVDLYWTETPKYHAKMKFEAILNKALAIPGHWCQDDNMEVNLDKTVSDFLSHSSAITTEPLIPRNNDFQTNCFSYLDINFDQKLTWRQHTQMPVECTFEVF